MAVTIGQVIALIKALGGKGGGGGGGGGVSDVKVNGTSVVDGSGVAKVPLANANTPGVSMVDDHGIISNSGLLEIRRASTEQIKDGQSQWTAIISGNAYVAAFFGLSKAAGADLRDASSVTVGTYPENSKSKISDMLNAPEAVSGTTPSITAKAGVRYVCGECASLDIAAPASGCIDVLFESGSTPTVLTITTAKSGVTEVKFPAWFDPDDLDADTTYEINILDGEFGAVSAWA